jgi:hypothetical protein
VASRAGATARFGAARAVGERTEARVSDDGAVVTGDELVGYVSSSPPGGPGCPIASA